MKKTFIVSVLALVASGAFCLGQGLSTNIGAPRVTLPKPSPSPERITPSARGGVIFTAVRNGNPLQMLNPAAPARYGNAQEHVSYDPKDPGKPKGIKLFEWTF